MEISQVKRTFAARLEREIAVRGWNQSDLARAATRHLPDGKELSRDNISNYMRARALPSPAFRLAIARALNVDPDDLLPETAIAPRLKVGPLSGMQDVGDGFAQIRIDKRLPWPVALEIMRLAQEDGKRISTE